MPREQAVWGIEIGQSALKAIRLKKTGETDVQAVAFDYVEHPKILSQPDADPVELMQSALETFLSRNQLADDRVVIGIPGQNGLIRFVKLPPVDPSKIPDIVKFEARQQIPFPLEEVIWDYQPIVQPGAGEARGFAGEQEVGLFAMKRDMVYNYLQPYLAAGVEVDVVQLRPLAVFNFAAYDLLGYPERQEPNPEGYIVVLEMGADNTDLVITDGVRVWQRSLTIGGNHFTRALTKELKLTFAKAEHLKKNATKAQDPRVLFQAMRPVFNDFVNEVQRSIGFFSTSHRRAKIAKVVGVGNAFKMPGLQKLLEQQLQVPVQRLEHFERLTGPGVVDAPIFQENAPGFAVVYGLALQGLDLAPIRTNLLPREIIRERLIRSKKPWVLTGAAMCAAAYALAFLGNWTRYQGVSESRYQAAEQLANSVLQEVNSNRQRFEQAKGEWEQVKRQGEALTANIQNRYLWLELLQTLTAELPKPGVPDLRNIAFRRDVFVQAVLSDYYANLNDWFSSIDLENPEVKLTALGLDLQNAPSGDGWVITLRGHHFNRYRENHTYAVLWKLQESARLRQLGVSHVLLTANQTFPWTPGSPVPQVQRASAGSRSGRSTGGGTSYAATGPSTYGTGAMGEEDYATSGMPPATGMSVPGATGARPQQQPREQVIQIPRTEFVIEFVWKPTPESERRSLEEVQQELADYLRTNPRPSPRTIQQQEQQAQQTGRPAGAPSGQGGAAGSSGAPPTPSGAGQQPATPGQTNGGAPSAPAGQTPGGQPQ